MKQVTRCMRSFGVMITVALLALPAWGQGNAGTGVGELNVSTTDGFCRESGPAVTTTSPNKFIVEVGSVVHMSITPVFNICTAGDPSKINKRCTTPSTNSSECGSTGLCQANAGTGTCLRSTHLCTAGKVGQSCSKNTDCNTTSCSSNSPTNANGSCTTNADCSLVGTCALSLECAGDPRFVINDGLGLNGGVGGFSIYTGTLNSTTGGIDLCPYSAAQCINGPIGYCPDGNGNARFFGNATIPKGTLTIAPAHVKVTDCGGPPVECTNQIGSLCCGLTQGSYGATQSVATCTAPNCGFNPLSGQPRGGYLVAAAFSGPGQSYTASGNVFANDPNATTIGVFGSKSVTIGPVGGGTCASDVNDGTCSTFFTNDLPTLIAYLPTSGTPGKFKPNFVNTDVNYATPSAIPDPSSGGSLGQGGGTLSGQSMACSLNEFLSGIPGGFAPSGFGGFTLPSAGTLVCTRRSGEDKTLISADDICQAFSYPTCVAGLTVDGVRQAANSQLATGSNTSGCSASDLAMALDNINKQFDQCGMVIACPGGVSPSSNGGTCASGICTISGASCKYDSDCTGTFTCPSS